MLKHEWCYGTKLLKLYYYTIKIYNYYEGLRWCGIRSLIGDNESI